MLACNAGNRLNSSEIMILPPLDTYNVIRYN